MARHHGHGSGAGRIVWREDDERNGAAIGPHADLEPEFAGAKVTAEIEGGCEKAIAHGDGIIGQHRSLRGPVVHLNQPETKTVKPIGCSVIVSEPALVSEGSAYLGVNRIQNREEAAKGCCNREEKVWFHSSGQLD